MRVLLDECVPVPLKREFAELGARTVRDMQWRGIKNGALLQRAADENFDAVLTVDTGLGESLGPSGAEIGVVLIRARKTDLRFLLPLVPATKAALLRIRPGEFVTVGG